MVFESDLSHTPRHYCRVNEQLRGGVKRIKVKSIQSFHTESRLLTVTENYC